MAAATYQQIRDALRQLYVDDPRPWLVGFSGGKDSTLVAALVFDAVMSIPPEQRTKPVTVLCTDTRVDGNSHKKAQRSQRTGSANLFSLSASNGEDPVRLGGLVDIISNIGFNESAAKSKDVLGRVYEYFLGKFASAEGKGGGEFYTPQCVMQVLVAMLEPYKGRVFDPRC